MLKFLTTKLLRQLSIEKNFEKTNERINLIFITENYIKKKTDSISDSWFYNSIWDFA